MEVWNSRALGMCYGLGDTEGYTYGALELWRLTAAVGTWRSAGALQVYLEVWGHRGLEAHDRCSDVEDCRHGALEAC